MELTDFMDKLGPLQYLTTPGVARPFVDDATLNSIGSGIKTGLVGSNPRIEQLQRFAPNQQQAMQQLLGYGLQGLQNPYQGFEGLARNARQNFEQKIVPSLAERFTSMGKNSLSSPLFATQLGQAGAQMETGLAALQSQYGLQNQQNMARLMSLGLQPQYENMNLPGSEGLLQGLLRVLPSLAGLL